jgi:putative glutamine amidotransferase
VTEADAPRPRIAVAYSMDADAATPTFRALLHDLARGALEALDGMGAEVVLVDSSRSDEDPQRLVRAVDGVLILGGADVDPAAYGEHPAVDNLYAVDPAADAFEIGLARRALDDGVPLLGICRGMQVMNVAAGGSLVQDLGGETMHNAPGEGAPLVDHDVALEPDSRLAQLYVTPVLSIRSGHHQAVDRLGAGLRVTAWATDGTTEAIESANGSWAVGVQWHPEDAGGDPEQLETLIAEFAGQAAEWRYRDKSPGPRSSEDRAGAF